MKINLKSIRNPQVIKTPVVRNGKQSTLGYQPDVWKSGIDYLRNLGKYKWNFHKYVKINITKNAVIQRKSQMKK